MVGTTLNGKGNMASAYILFNIIGNRAGSRPRMDSTVVFAKKIKIDRIQTWLRRRRMRGVHCHGFKI